MVKLREAGDTYNIWAMLLKKLEQFMENRPNENVVLCEIFLKLLGQVVRLDSLQILQWVIYLLQMKEKKKPSPSARKNRASKRQ